GRFTKNVKRPPRSFSDGPAADCHAIDGEHQHGTQQRHQEAGWLVGPIHSDGPANPSTNDGADHSKQHGQDDPAWIATRHDELRECAHDETKDDPPNHAKHAVASWLLNSTSRAGCVSAVGL